MPVLSLTPSNMNMVNNTPGVQGSTTPAEAQKKFTTFLKESIDHVNAAQVQSDVLTEKMAKGENVDLHNVLITAQKASIMLSTTIEVRNKAIEAYQEIMRMQV